MPVSPDRFGLSAALTTPFRGDGAVDLARFAGHARHCLDTGCDGVTAFGTTGEGASIGIADREQMLDCLDGAGIDGRRQVVAGVAAAAVADAAAQGRMALDAPCRALLVAPPFYFKGVSEDGLYRWFAGLIEALGGAARDLILYNIPAVTGVALPVPLIGRLKTGFPGIVIGVKDSSGDWGYTEALLAAHGELAILIGDERHLARGVQRGAQGAISGLANVCPQVLKPSVASGVEDPRIIRLVEELLRFPVTPAVKALVAHHHRDPAWLTTRPPLIALERSGIDHMTRAYDTLFAAQAV